MPWLGNASLVLGGFVEDKLLSFLHIQQRVGIAPDQGLPSFRLELGLVNPVNER